MVVPNTGTEFKIISPVIPLKDDENMLFKACALPSVNISDAAAQQITMIMYIVMFASSFYSYC